MAKKALLTTNDGVYHKIKKGYLTLESTYRRVKKAYTTVGGVYRPCWSSGGTLVYYGTTPQEMISARDGAAATSVGNYALFGGYHPSDPTVFQSQLYGYDKSLVRHTSSFLSRQRHYLAATTIGGYALFGGGCAYDSGKPHEGGGYTFAVVDAFDETLTRSTPAALGTQRDCLAATTVGNCALFGGGYCFGATTDVDSYNKSLTKSNVTSYLRSASYNLTATTVGSYALFGGGYNTNYLSTVTAYNSSLTRSSPASLSATKEKLAATTVGKYALFAGGYNGAYSKGVDVYDASLTKSTATDLSKARSRLGATTIEDYALFTGGFSGQTSTDVDVYDASLTKTTVDPLSARNTDMCGTTVGSYALFAGSNSTKVEVYAMVEN